METYNNIPTFHATNRAAWRQWLEKNHQSGKSVWLIMYKKESGVPSVYHSEAVDEALCFGWIDSKAIRRDADSRYQYFAQRKPKSNWSRVNKAKVTQLIEQGLMTEAGLQMIDLAKEKGTWTALDEVENLTLPDDLKVLFDQSVKAFQNWQLFPRSVKRGILEWIQNARRPETRQKRMKETVLLAAENRRANFPGQ